MQLEMVNTGELIPYVNNARTHSPEQVAQIAASIKEFGFLNPVIIDQDNVIIAGHGRLMAANMLKLESVPVVRAEHLTEAQKKAYVLADNQLALNAGWDYDLLKVEVEGLQELDFDVGLLGFDDSFLEQNLFIDEQGAPPELGLTPEEKLDNFLNSDTKILRLAFDNGQFEKAIELLDEGIKKTGVENYSDYVFGLLLKNG